MLTINYQIGDHVRHEHKARLAWGIIREFSVGLFGEQRARVEWIAAPHNGSPFPVPLDTLSPDVHGVVAGSLKAKRRYVALDAKNELEAAP